MNWGRLYGEQLLRVAELEEGQARQEQQPIAARIRAILETAQGPLLIDEIHARMPDVARAKIANTCGVYADHQKFERIGCGRQARYCIPRHERSDCGRC